MMKRVVNHTHDSPANYFLASTGAITFQARLFELVTEQQLELDWSKMPPLPIELITWLCWRRNQGLEHATHGHPLLESPLATLDPPPSVGTASELMAMLDLGIPHMRAYLAPQVSEHRTG